MDFGAIRREVPITYRNTSENYNGLEGLKMACLDVVIFPYLSKIMEQFGAVIFGSWDEV